jgi:triosephosphate isomerase
MSTASTRRSLVAGNWKLHNTIEASLALAQAVRERCQGVAAEVVVAPVFTALAAVRDALRASQVGLAAQDVYFQDKGAFTGQVSAPLLKDVGCSYGIVGHSERRQFFGDSDESVRKKVRALLASAIAPILCVGESLEQR